MKEFKVNLDLTIHEEAITEFQTLLESTGDAQKAQDATFSKYSYAKEEWAKINEIRKFIYDNFEDFIGFAQEFSKVFAKDDFMIGTLMEKVIGHIKKKVSQDKEQKGGKKTEEFVLSLSIGELALFYSVIQAAKEYRKFSE